MKPIWTEVAVLVVLLFFALVMAHGWPWPTGHAAESPKITDWLTAFGTVGAVFAAIFVPLHQNRDRRREQLRERLKSEWALAQEVYKISFRLCEIGQSMKTLSPQSLTEISHLQSQLSAAKLSTTDRVGRLLIDDLLYVVVYMHDEALRRAAGVSALHAQAVALEKAKPIDDETERNLNSLPVLRRRSLDWLERVISRLETLGVVSSAIVRASGKATMEMHGSGDGRAQNHDDKATAPPT